MGAKATFYSYGDRSVMPLTRPKKVPTANLAQGSSFLTTASAISNSQFPSNTIIQRVVGTTNAAVSVTNNSAFVATGLYVDITPTNSSNKIHLDFDWKIYMQNSSAVSATNWAVYKKIGSGSMSAWKFVSGWDNYLNRSSYTNDFYPHQRYFVIDDNIGTSSTIRYEMYVKRYGSAAGVQSYFHQNASFDATYAPGFGSNDQVPRGILIAEEIKT